MQEAKEFIGLLAEAIEKGVFQAPDGSTGRIQMFARGPYQPGESYQRGDVVSVSNGPIYICLEDTKSDPRSNSTAWLILQAIGYGGGYGSALGGSVTPPTPVFNFVSQRTGGNDNNLGGLETLILIFDSAPNVASLSAPADATGTPVPGSWVVAGVSATFTPSVTWLTLPSPFSVSTTGVTGANGIMIAAPQTILINSDYPPGVFAFDSVVTQDNDGTVFDLQYVDVNFLESTNDFGATLPSWYDAWGLQITGAWSPTATGFRFTPFTNWQANVGPYRLDLGFHTNNAGIPLINPQTVTIQRDGTIFVPKPLSFERMYVQSGVSNTAVVGTRERLAAVFNRPVSPTTVVNTVVTRSDNGAPISGSWAFFGSEAWFTPDAAWPAVSNSTPAYIFKFNGVLAVDNGDPLTGVDANGDLIHRFSLATFTLLDFATGEADGTLYDNESIILTFDAPPDMSTLPTVDDGGGGVVLGTWTLSGNTVTFVPSANWQNYDEPFAVITGDILGANGAPNSFGPTIIINYDNFLFLSHSPSPSGFELSGSQPISATFNSDGIVVYPTVTENGMPKNGSWSGTGPTVTFTPGSPWSPMGNVMMVWTNVATARQPVMNPGFATFTVRDQFLFLDSTPADDRFIPAIRFAGHIGPEANGTIILGFNRDVNASSLPLPTINGSPVPGTWTSMQNLAVFRNTNPMPVNTSIIVSYAGAVSTAGIPVTNPDFINLFVTPRVSQQFALPATPSFTGTTQIFVQFDGPIDIQDLALPTFTNLFGVPGVMGGTWAVVGTNGSGAQFTPIGSWPPGNARVNTSGVKDRAGQQILNPQLLQWTVTL